MVSFLASICSTETKDTVYTNSRKINITKAELQNTSSPVVFTYNKLEHKEQAC